MINFVKHKSLQVSAAVFTGLIGGVESAHAGNDFSSISNNISESITELPGLLTGVSYMMGILLGVLGILKIKDHVENPQTKLQDGAIRLAAGGALFALPIVYEAMQNTIGADGAGPNTISLDSVGNWTSVD